MAKELVLDVVARKSSRDLQLLAAEFDKLAASVDGSNKSAQQSVKFSKFLDDQISETRKQVQQLAQEFDKTGSADVFGQLRGAQRNLDSLVRIRKTVVDFTDAQKEATKELEGSEKVLRGLSDDYSKLGADVRRVEQDYKDLTERIKVQTETVRTLQKESRAGGATPFDISYYRQASKALEDLKVQGEDLRDVLKAAPEDASKRFESFDQFVVTRIAGQRSLVASLESDLKKTGNVSVFGDLDKAKKDLAVLESLGKDLGIAIQSGVQDGAQQGIKGLANSFGALPPEVQAAIGLGVVGAIAASASFIGAAINGALLAGVGLGGIAAGIVGQLKTPQVAAAFADLKNTGLSVLTDSTKAFAPILVNTAHEFENALLHAEPVLTQAFDRLAPHAENIFRGLENFAKQAAPGFLKALAAAGPILDQLGRDFADLGKVTSDFFSQTADGSVGAKEGLHDLFLLIEGTVEAVGFLLKTLSLDFQLLHATTALFKGDISEITGNTTTAAQVSGDAGKAAAVFAAKLAEVGSSAVDAAGAIDKLNQSYDKLIGKNLSADQAAIQQKQSVDDLSASIKQNGNAWDINTEAGRKNQDALLNAIQAAEQKRQADINNGKDAIQAAQDYNQEVDALLGVAGRAGDAKSNLDKLKGKYEIDVQEYYTTHFINEGTPPSQFFHGLAAGGPVTAGQPYIVGENGPELFMSDTSGQIIPNDKLKSLQNLSSPPPNFRTNSAVASGPTVTFAGDTNSAFATAFMGLVRTGQIQIT